MQFMQKQSGVTLIELTVVLLILVALAGLTIPYMSGTSSAALCKATDVTMQNVKKVIMERYYLDTLGYFPKSTKAGNDYSLKYLFTPPLSSANGGWDSFNAETQLGWRQGGYLQSGIALDAKYVDGNLNNEELGANLKDSTGVYTHTAFAANDFVVNDAWGRPIVLQDTGNGFRLISAGAGSGLAIGDADINTPHNSLHCWLNTTVNPAIKECNDDRILYLNAATPTTDINPSCDE
jgi:type II secretory pathway pseudopilin PulG